MKKALKTTLFVVLAILYFGYLEIWKNQLFAWPLAIGACILYGIMQKKVLCKLEGFKRIIPFFLLAGLLLVIAAVSGPQTKRIKAIDDKNPEYTEEVQVQEGKLVGVKDKSKEVEIFAGVPYAKPPVGELRWKETQPAEPWEGVKVCDTYAPMAMQDRGNPIMNFGSSIVGYNEIPISLKDNYLEEMSEDCLYLNVYRPFNTSSEDRLPVLVYIHGGSLKTGQSYYQAYNGESLSSQGIIVVSIAYRLGVFGYMADPELVEESANNTTGNYGLLDQIQALKWVNENIAAFGGDAGNITIAGESAGASSVNALCVSPLAKGLFRRAVAESSGITPRVPYHTFRPDWMAFENGKKLKEEFKCSSVEELRNISAEELVKTSARNSEMMVDGYAIVKQPYLTYEAGENNEESLLSGFNADEARAFIVLDKKATVDTYEDYLASFADDYAGELAALRPVSNNKEADANYDELIGLAWFGYSHYTWSNYLAEQGKPCYMYYFAKENKALGTWHAGELPYFYGNIPDSKNYTDEDRNLSAIIQKYYVNYVKTGNPNGEDLPNWSTYNEEPFKYLQLSQGVEMVDNKFIDVFKIYDKVMEDRYLDPADYE